MKAPSLLRAKLGDAKPQALTELEHRRARAQLLERAREQALSERRAPRRFVGLAAAACVVAGLLGAAHRARRADIVALGTVIAARDSSANPHPAPIAAVAIASDSVFTADTPPARVARAETPRPHASAPGPGASFDHAFTDFEKNKYGMADLEFERFLRDFPGDPRAEDASYLRAVARLRLGDREGAAALARVYLDAYPAGLRRPEAQRMADQASN